MKKSILHISGKVIHGDNYGKTLGFPTANLDRRDFIRRKLKIKFGVWAGTASYKLPVSTRQSSRGGSARTYKLYKAGIVIGPIDNHRLPKIEAHLIGFRGSLYGKRIVISLQKYLRPFKKFKNESILKSQIKNDLKKIKQIYS